MAERHRNPQRRHDALEAALVGAIRAYQLSLSSIMGRRCRFLPTCSDYAQEAIRRHGAKRGSWLALRRVARCHPWGGSGFDPVPDSIDSERKKAPE